MDNDSVNNDNTRAVESGRPVTRLLSRREPELQAQVAQISQNAILASAVGRQPAFVRDISESQLTIVSHGPGQAESDIPATAAIADDAGSVISNDSETTADLLKSVAEEAAVDVRNAVDYFIDGMADNVKAFLKNPENGTNMRGMQIKCGLETEIRNAIRTATANLYNDKDSADVRRGQQGRVRYDARHFYDIVGKFLDVRRECVLELAERVEVERRLRQQATRMSDLKKAVQRVERGYEKPQPALVVDERVRKYVDEQARASRRVTFRTVRKARTR